MFTYKGVTISQWVRFSRDNGTQETIKYCPTFPTTLEKLYCYLCLDEEGCQCSVGMSGTHTNTGVAHIGFPN